MALGGLQVVPFEGDTGQSEMRLRRKPLPWITHQLPDAPVGVGRERQLVVAFLYLAQTEHRRGRIDGISKRATTDGYDLGVGSAGVGPLPLDLMRITPACTLPQSVWTSCRGADIPGRDATGR